jgi:tetratricopeptide (TPR) repeat protein
MRFPGTSAMLKLLLAAAISAPCHAAPRTNELVGAVETFRVAYFAWDADGLQDAADRTAALCRRNPRWAPAQYWCAVCEFHLALQAAERKDGASRKAAAGHLDRAETCLERLLELDPGHGEAHALLGAVQGMRIAGNRLSAVWRGPAVKRHQGRALKLAGGNPRVHYLAGCSFFHAPALLGGRRKGLKHFHAAEKLYAAEQAATPHPLAPRWGRSSCYAFLGKTYEDEGKRERAVDYYRRCLAINPRNRIAIKGLAALEKEETP